MSRVALFLLAAGCFSKPPAPKPIIGRTWQQRANAEQPGALLDPKLAYVPERGTVVMYGGESDANVSNKMWELTSNGWASLCTTCLPGGLWGQGMT